MDLMFIDDSKQESPSREGMGSLVGVGGLYVPSDSVHSLTTALDEICDQYGFPSSEDEFKWSPDQGTWFRQNLAGQAREGFYMDCLQAASDLDAQACVVIEDKLYKTTKGKYEGHELDAVRVFLERAEYLLSGTDTEAILIADNPSGGRTKERQFVANCLDTLRAGTQFMDLERTALVFTQDSKNTRLLQLADLVVGCTVAYVGGEGKYSPPLFEHYIKPMLRCESGRIGGVGLKLHPDFLYANLYHWLLGDDTLWKGRIGEPLPISSRPYAQSAESDSIGKPKPVVISAA